MPLPKALQWLSLTFGELEDMNLGEVDLLHMRAQGVLHITKEVSTGLSLAKLLHESIVSVGAATRLVHFDDGNVGSGSCANLAKASRHIALQAFGADDDNCSNYGTSASAMKNVGGQYLPANSETMCWMISYPSLPWLIDPGVSMMQPA